MSGPLQVGDIIAIASLAKQLFDYGWERRYSSSRKYNEFGQDVDALRYNLDLLAQVIQSADSKLHDLTASRTAVLRWDPQSLRQIVGDCWETIHECDQLLSDNSSYAFEAGPVRNVRWNLMVQDDVDALQFRIQQHTAKIHLALAPFEIDLLTSIQRSIQEMHVDLRDSIREVRRDVQDVRREVLRLQGVVVPELQQGLDRQEAHTALLTVPTAIKDKLDQVFHKTTTRAPSLAELADAFVTHFYESTYSFQPVSRIARDRVPPDKAYLNLMKCVWLLEKCKENEEFKNMPEGSHWVSYLAELEKVLSDECRRFEDDLVTPPLPPLSEDLLRIWRRAKSRSSTVIVPREAELVLSTKVVQRAGDDGEPQELRLQLLRYLDETNGQEFTINTYKSTQDDVAALVDSLDFNLRTAVLIPRYVVGDPSARAVLSQRRPPEPPRPRGGQGWSNQLFRRVEYDGAPSDRVVQQQQQTQALYRVTLGTGRRFDTFNFKRLKDATAFQHAITGYLVQGPKSFTANVTLVYSNQGPRRHRAYVQVWYPLRKEVDLSTRSDLYAGGSTTTTSSSGTSERISSSSLAPLASSPRSSLTAFHSIHTRGGGGTATPSSRFRDPFAVGPPTRQETGRDNSFHRSSGALLAGAGARGPNRRTSVNSIACSPTTEPAHGLGRSPPGLGGLMNLGRVPESLSASREEGILLPPRVPRSDAQNGWFVQDRQASLAEQQQQQQQNQASLSRRTSLFSSRRSTTRTTPRSSITTSTLETEPSSSTTCGSSSGSSSSSSTTIGVDMGNGITGVLHTPPPKPMIVLFIDNDDCNDDDDGADGYGYGYGYNPLGRATMGERAIVTLDLPTSEVRPDLCDCRRSDPQGRNCRDVCLERNRQGFTGGGSRRSSSSSSFLQARLLCKPTTTTTMTQQSTYGTDGWDLSRLAYTRRGYYYNDDNNNSSSSNSGSGSGSGSGSRTNKTLANLTRVTISFTSALDRRLFCGDVFCGCPNRGVVGLETDRQRRECVREQHRGIVGQAREYYLKELRAFESAEAARTHVVHGPRPND